MMKNPRMRVFAVFFGLFFRDRFSGDQITPKARIGSATRMKAAILAPMT